MLSGVKMGYSVREKQKIVDYIIRKKAHDRIRTSALYKEMAEDNVVPQRTYRSLQNVFGNHIITNIKNYCDAKQCQIFDRNWQKTRAQRKKPNTQRPALPTYNEDSESDDDCMVLENVQPRGQTNLIGWVQNRPRTQSANQQNAAQHSKQMTSQHNQPRTAQHSRSGTLQPANQQNATQHSKQMTSQHNQLRTAQHSRSGTLQPANQQNAIQHSRPVPSQHSRLATSQQNQPSTSQQSRLLTSQQNPSRPAMQGAQTQGNTNKKLFLSQGFRVVPMRLAHRGREEEEEYEEDKEWISKERQMYPAGFVGPNVEKYTNQEDKALINFLDNMVGNVDDLKFDGNWREFGTSAILPGRSWQSLKSRYYELKKARNLDHLQLPVSKLKRLSLPCKTNSQYNSMERPQVPRTWPKPNNHPPRPAPQAPSYHLSEDEALNDLLQEDDTPDLMNHQPRATQRQAAVGQLRPRRHLSPVYQGSQPEDGHISPPRNSQRNTDTTTYQPRATQRQAAVRQPRPRRHLSPIYQGSQPEDGHISPPRNTDSMNHQPRATQRQAAVGQLRPRRHLSPVYQGSQPEDGHISPPRNSQRHTDTTTYQPKAIQRQIAARQPRPEPQLSPQPEDVLHLLPLRNENIVDNIVDWFGKDRIALEHNKDEIPNEESGDESLPSSPEPVSPRGSSPDSFVMDSPPRPVAKTQFSKLKEKPPKPPPPVKQSKSAGISVMSLATDFRSALHTNIPHIQKSAIEYRARVESFQIENDSDSGNEFDPEKNDHYSRNHKGTSLQVIVDPAIERNYSDDDDDDSQKTIPAPFPQPSRSMSTLMSEDRAALSTSRDKEKNVANNRDTPDFSLHYSSDSNSVTGPSNDQPKITILAPESPPPPPEPVATCDEFEARKIIPESIMGDSDNELSEDEDIPETAEKIVTSVRSKTEQESKTNKQKQTLPRPSMTFNVTNYNQQISSTNVIPQLQQIPSNIVYIPPQYPMMGQASSVDTEQRHTMRQTSNIQALNNNLQIQNLIQIANSVTQPVILVVPSCSAQEMHQPSILPQLTYHPQAPPINLRETLSPVQMESLPQQPTNLRETMHPVQPESLPQISQQTPTNLPETLPSVQKESLPQRPPTNLPETPVQLESLPPIPPQPPTNLPETPAQRETLPQIEPDIPQQPATKPPETLPAIQRESLTQSPTDLPETLPLVQPESLHQDPRQPATNPPEETLLPVRGESFPHVEPEVPEQPPVKPPETLPAIQPHASLHETASSVSSSSCHHSHHCHSCNDSDHSHMPRKRKIIKIVKARKKLRRHSIKSSGTWIVTDIETSDQETSNTSAPSSSPSTSTISTLPQPRQSNVIAQEFERLASKGAYIINKKDK